MSGGGRVCQAEGCDSAALTEFTDGAGRVLALCEEHGDLLAVGFPLKRPATVVDLDRAEALAAAATPGAWEAYFTVHGDPYVLGRPADRHGRDPLFPQDIVATVATGPADYGRGDAEFIAAARQLVPALVARVRELEANADRRHREHVELVDGLLAERAILATRVEVLERQQTDRSFATVHERAAWMHDLGRHAGADHPYQFCPRCEIEHPQGRLALAEARVRELTDAGNTLADSLIVPEPRGSGRVSALHEAVAVWRNLTANQE